jgi:hypothetical protein
MRTTTTVAQLPTCDLCRLNNKNVPAYADARLVKLGGTWAYVCKEDFDTYGCELGTGKGQQFVVATSPQQCQDERIREKVADVNWEKMTFGEFDEIFEDRDPFEFL